MKNSGEVYLDASVLVALLTNDPFTDQADAFLRTNLPVLVISDFAAAEFAAAVAHRVRTGEIAVEDGHIVFSNFDAWAARAARRESTKTADVAAAEAFLRRLDLNLRTADALNIAIAQRITAALATFDEKMAANARILGMPIAAL
jgi:predicted nucleic acid-binding protein